MKLQNRVQYCNSSIIADYRLIQCAYSTNKYEGSSLLFKIKPSIFNNRMHSWWSSKKHAL